ncbi:unnamed protein product [Allacma fusca]|uniref:Uncharacterized protein n=1 Tax=Allacma fusca TaxID=39272 RepID=A0A8J2LAP3_9HEXA|nr:unnamed protein product [Allacma fusca]
MNNSKSALLITPVHSNSAVRVHKKMAQSSPRNKSNKKRQKQSQKDIATSAMTDKNFQNFRWDSLPSLHAIGILKEAKSNSVARCASTLSYVEFKHLSLLTNVILILENCPLVQTLVFTNVRLNSFSRSYGSFLTVGVTKLIFYGADKLTKDEIHIINFLHKRVTCEHLKTIYFSRKSGQSGKPKKAPPVNDITNTSTSSLLANFLGKCAKTLRVIQADRPIALFTDGNIRKVDPAVLRLDKLKLNMHSPGFDLLLNSQKQLSFLDCQNTEALSPYEFESILVCVQRCAKTLKTIQLNHKFEFKIDNKILGDAPPVVVHDCTLYSECRKVKHLRLILSSNRFLDNQKVKPCRVTNISKLPLSLVSFVLSFDQIPNECMIDFASKCQSYTLMEFMSLVGNPEWPFIFTLPWIRTLLQLPQLELLHLQNYKIKYEQSELDKLKEDLKYKLDKFLFTPKLCVFRKIPSRKNSETAVASSGLVLLKKEVQQHSSSFQREEVEVVSSYIESRPRVLLAGCDSASTNGRA